MFTLNITEAVRLRRGYQHLDMLPPGFVDEGVAVWGICLANTDWQYRVRDYRWQLAG